MHPTSLVSVWQGATNYARASEIHQMVNDALNALKLRDDFIECGNNVVLKPNWVKEHDERHPGPNQWEHVVTHPSVIEGVVAWVDPKLQGTGSIISEAVKVQAIQVMRMIGAEEDRIRGLELCNVHLHEIGGEDAIINIVGCLLGIEHLGIRCLECSPLPLGRGCVKGTQGNIPLPAPATVALLKGVLITGSEINAELVTPTSAALLKHLVTRFGSIPSMNIESIGFGTGTRDLPIPNLLRVFIGERADEVLDADIVTVLETNIDVQNPDHYERIMDLLFASGVLDVSLVSALMKKGRTGTLMTVVCIPENKQRLLHILFAETSTLGGREQELKHSLLPRHRQEIQTRFGKAHVKIATLPDGSCKLSPEYEDCRTLAVGSGIALLDVYAEVEVVARALSCSSKWLA